MKAKRIQYWLAMLIIVGVIAFLFIGNKKDTPKIITEFYAGNRGANLLKAGFAALKTTPEVPDRWEDKDNNAKYSPGDGDTFTDGNNNGKFDPVWIAGFGNARAANGIHDDLWARCVVVESGNTRLAMVSLDAIGLMNPEVEEIRKLIPSELKINYLIVSSTHTHEGPDMLGLWGKSPYKSGIDPDYMKFVRTQVAESVKEAATKLQPVSIEISEELEGAKGLLTDTREPEYFDSGLRILNFKNRENGQTMGTLINWGNHPETLWGKNLLITSDFPHFFRQGVENGVFRGDSLKEKGVGGICVYVSGAVGGLMTTHPRVSVTDPFTGEKFDEPTFGKAEAEGKHLSLLALNAMKNPVERIDSAPVEIYARKITLPVRNKLFRLGLLIGVFDREGSGINSMETEIAFCRIGPVSIATFPGEIYPEIINGTVEAPDGGDFKVQPVETPPVRELMPGKYKFVFGLANDEIGYIIPKSQWDEKSPYTYKRTDSPYGEENSLGPETAPLLHSNLKALIDKSLQKNR